MIHVLVSVQDRATGAFQPISTVRAIGEAIRGFQDAISNPNNAQLHQHPDDFDMYVVGHMDDDTGIVTPEPGGPRKIADGKQLMMGGK